jgi:hypothetical protein
MVTQGLPLPRKMADTGTEAACQVEKRYPNALRKVVRNVDAALKDGFRSMSATLSKFLTPVYWGIGGKNLLSSVCYSMVEV